ncbi:retroviral-like aspartic protease family protein [Sphingomonas sp. LY160]|uniref:retroviral-like aspartic protease family protein n=1 Tax=Sphingomonas sp. LY160 TaxID=3095342 RepID=UPI002ADED595|nr:retroviral-like aspartic protease family protein [Sphingomonas sp. LY160]MEA1071466.1 retroviral-like aspartic protease family protein [Sphingomonas sp. LY160]
MLFAILILAATTPVAAPQPQAAPVDSVSLAKSLDDRMTVQVKVAGQGPYRFLVDTGSERTVISRELAERLGLAGGRRVTLHSVLGSSGVNTVDIPSMSMSRGQFSIAGAPALDEAHIGADGMLGIDSLKKQRVLFDFKAGTMSVSPSVDPVTEMDGETVVVRARARKGRLIFTNAVVDDNHVTVIIDTGSQISVGNPRLMERLSRGSSAAKPIVIESVTGEKGSAKLAILNDLQLGGMHIKSLPVAFADAHIFRQLNLDRKPALLLGMNAMRAFDRVSIDFASKRVRFVLPETGMLDVRQMAAR